MRKNQIIAFSSLTAIIIVAAAFAWNSETIPGFWSHSTASLTKSMTTASGLQIEILQEGSGEEAKAGNTVAVHYTGWLTDGTKFDSSVDRGQPFSFPLDAGRVIKGWDEGVAGMKIGEKRKLTIPPSLGYGVTGTPGGPIPPNAVLVFEVELMDVK